MEIKAKCPYVRKKNYWPLTPKKLNLRNLINAYVCTMCIYRLLPRPTSAFDLQLKLRCVSRERSYSYSDVQMTVVIASHCFRLFGHTP